MKTRRRLLGLLVFLFFMTTGGLCFGQVVPGVTADTIKLGVLSDLTGKASYYGRACADATTVYFKYVNEKGGINGRKVEVIVEDHQWNVSQNTAAAKKLLKRDNVFALPISYSTLTTQAMIPLIEEEKVPTIAISEAREMFMPPKRYLFATGTPYDLQIEVALNYITKNLKKKDAKFGLLFQDDDSGVTCRRVLEKWDKEGKIKFVRSEPFKQGDVDYSTQAVNLNRFAPDYTVLMSEARTTASFLREAKKIGFSCQFIGVSSAVSSGMLDLAGDASEGFWGINSKAETYEDVPGMVFLRQVTEKQMGKYDINPYYVYGWVNALVMGEGLKRAGRNLTREGLVNGLESLKNFDVGGLVAPITYGPNKRFSGDKARLVKVDIQNKKFIPIAEWRGPED